MSRKSLILSLVALAVMVLGVGVAVAVLYSGGGSSQTEAPRVADQDRYLLLPAVPSDAVAVMCLSEADGQCAGILPADLRQAAGDSRIAVSLHHSGKELVPLYVIDGGKASQDPADFVGPLLEAAKGCGMSADSVACVLCDGVGRHLSGRRLVIASRLDNLVKSSLRHLQNGESVMDAHGFVEVAAETAGNDVVFLSDVHASRMLSAAMTRPYQRYSSFFSRFAEWTAFSVKDDLSFTGISSCVKGQADFMRVLEASEPLVSSLSSVLPSYVIFAVSLPMKNPESYISAYQDFMDSRQQLATYRAGCRTAAEALDLPAEDIAGFLKLEEMAAASFKVAGAMERVNLMRIGKDALARLCPDAAAKDYSPAVHRFDYAGLSSALFGRLFSLNDESCCTFVNGWLVTGSRKAVEEYVVNEALEYTLADKMKDSGKGDLLARRPSVLVAYFSLTEDKDLLPEVFSKTVMPHVSSLTDGYDYCPVVMNAVKGKKHTELHVDLLRTSVKRSKAPLVERDTTVVVPEGPFQVKNSGTGKMNTFYQNSHMSLCLREDGKDLWGIPFDRRICGTAGTIDYYANGKLQILFGAGTRIYLIDRLGRFVNGFPVDLGKEILVGPQPYDFNGVHKYNIMVLHKDNTIEMYNLKGRKPDSWKGITAKETIKGLPEKISAGGKSYWVVRTSVQTLIYPLMGGETLTAFEGDRMIRPDSEIKVLDGPALGFECYDGESRTLKL